MRLFAVVLVFSIIVHIGILLLPLPEKQLKKNEIVPVTVVDIKKEELQKKEAPKPEKVVEKKNIPVEKETAKNNTKNQAVKENKPTKNNVKQTANNASDKKISVNNNAAKTQKEQKKASEVKEAKESQIEEKPFRPKGADDPLILPDISVPLTNNMDIPEIKVPDIPKPNIKNEMVENKRDIDIANELASLKSNETAQKSDNVTNDLAGQVQKEAQSSIAANNNSNTNLYNFDIAPTGNRKVLYVPKDPVFALANDTYVTLKFNIDKKGNTYNITFLTRSSVDVEKLAYDYVNNMKFDAIIEDRDDFAQITMYFKVQK